jgi:hypothetical protein
MSIRKSEALRAAMRRIINGKPIRLKDSWDGKRTWENVYKEAGVPRSTAARAKDIIAEWDTLLGGRVKPPQASTQDASSKQAGKSGETTAVTIRGLRDTIRTLANHIQALMLLSDEQGRTIAKLTEQLESTSGIVNLSSRRP